MALSHMRSFSDAVQTPPTNGGGLWDSVTGSPTVVVDATSPSGYAFQVSPSAAEERGGKNFADQDYLVVSFYVKFYVALPSADCELFFGVCSDTDFGSIWFDQSNTKFRAQFDNSGQSALSTNTISVDTWYRIDVRIYNNANPRTLDWYVDGTSETQVSYTATGTPVTGWRLGTYQSETFTAHYHSLCVSYSSGDYPIAGSNDVWCKRLDLTADGTHSNAGGTITDASGNAIDGSTYFGYQQLDEIPMNESAVRIQQESNGTSDYVEMTFEDPGFSFDSIKGAMGVLAWSAAGNPGNEGACIISTNGFTNSVEIYGTPASPADYSVNQNIYYASAVVTATTTSTAANGLVQRVGYSGDANPDPWWLNSIVEIAYQISGAANLVVNDAFSTSQVDAVVLTQVHILTVSDAFSTSQTDNVVLTQVHNLQVDDASCVSQVDEVTISQAVSLTVDDASCESQTDNVVLTQLHVLQVQDAGSDSQADNVVLTQVHNLIVDDGSSTSQVDAVTVSQAQQLSVDDASCVSQVDTISLTQVHVLVVQDGSSISQADNITLTQLHVLQVQDGASTSQVDAVTVSQAQQLSVNDAFCESQSDNVVLTQVHNLQPNDAFSTSQADNVTLAAPGELVIQDASCVSQVDAVTLTQVHNLQPNDAFSTSQADTLDLTQVHVLVVPDSFSTSQADILTLTQLHVLQVPDCYSISQADNVILSVGGDPIVESWTLRTRSAAWTVRSRSTGLQLKDRSSAWTVDDR